MKKSLILILSILFATVLAFLFIPSSNSYAAGMMGGNSGNGMMDNDESGHMTEHSVDLVKSTAPEKELALPPILKPDKQTKNDVYYTVTAKSGTTDFKDGGSTETLGYNGTYLGPVIKIRRGQTVHIKEVNDLNENTTFHWHGAIIDGKADGGPHDPIKPGKTKNISFKVQQPAATLWFHPHPSGQTAKQVYKGLAGLIYVSDNTSKNLKIPKNYGVDDFPLVVQDRTFDSKNQFNYKKDYNSDGTLGENILVNGTLNPYINVTTKFVRLRLLNGSNARNYTFKLSNNQKMYQIAGDGSFLSKPDPIKKLTLAPAQRAEVLVDTSSIPDGESLELVAGGIPVVTLKMQARTDNIKRMPKSLLKMVTAKAGTHDVDKQTLTLSGMSKMVEINGKQFNPDRIDIHTKVGQQQVWTVKNKKQMMNMSHPFHLHGVQFRILSINGHKPPLNETGYMDTVNLKPGDSVKLTFKFEKKGLYMYHCHNLEHEQNGMMGQIMVE
ncbi:multicopper oxidase family protein [Companilactobacillus mishanensis]|uniref:multicopper oxidase family protein n=1 Tax=Companilactobacillus mishanensis TaxID=2486008 RepID=UPI001295A694|nr:multicopper oxidase domain-containing protein [Companilactobacillus mishanensis]MQS89071.1 copper oxidase [Companilactobacillus mishanensis]